MLPGYTLRLLLQGLTLSLLGPVCKAVSLGLTVAAVPVESDGGRTVGNLCTNTHTQCSHSHRFENDLRIMYICLGFNLFSRVFLTNRTISGARL